MNVYIMECGYKVAAYRTIEQAIKSARRWQKLVPSRLVTVKEVTNASIVYESEGSNEKDI